MKICFLGFGRRGKTIYGHLTAIKGVSVVGIFDPISSNSYPVSHYTDPRVMFSECKPDLIIDAAPPGYRFKNIMLCNEFKIPVICEKPLIFSNKELKTLKKVNINIYPAYQLNYDSLIQKLFLITNVQGIKSIALEQRINFRVKGWRNDKRIAGGGVLFDNGAHLINLVVQKFGLPRKVFADSRLSLKSGIESLVEGFLWYENFTVKFFTSWYSPVGKKTKIDITTKTKDIHFIETNQGKALRTCSSMVNGGWTRRIEENFYESRGLDRDLKKNPFNQFSTDATFNMLHIFIDDIFYCRGRRSALAKDRFQAAIKTTHVINELYNSYNKGKIVKL